MKQSIRLFSIVALIALLFITGVAKAQFPAALHVDGVRVERGNGERFLFSGINVEMYRDLGCTYPTNGYYDAKDAFADKFLELGINSVRLNYSFRNIPPGSTNFDRFIDVAETYIKRGIYVMPSDHTYTGAELNGASASYPVMRAIIGVIRARGLDENYLIMNPWNEPGPNVDSAEFLLAYQKVINDLRVTSTFDGLIVVDGSGWSTLLDVPLFQKLMQFDAKLRSDLTEDTTDALPAKLVFSHHLYPNITIGGLPTRIGNEAANVPLLLGELGQENPGSSPLDPGYVRNIFTAMFSKWIPNGHNAGFPWIGNWCDTNKMWEDWKTNPSVPYAVDDKGKLIEKMTSYGNLVATSFYRPLQLTQGAPPLILTATARATNTAVRSATPRPTNTPQPTATPRLSLTPSPTLTPSTTLTPSSTNTATPRPQIVVTGEFGGTPFGFIIERR